MACRREKLDILGSPPDREVQWPLPLHEQRPAVRRGVTNRQQVATLSLPWPLYLMGTQDGADPAAGAERAASRSHP